MSALPRLRPWSPELRDELPLPRELEDLRVLLSAARNPDVVFVVDEYPVLDLRPFVPGARTAPRGRSAGHLVEFEHGRRRNAALRLWWRCARARETLVRLAAGWADEAPRRDPGCRPPSRQSRRSPNSLASGCGKVGSY